MTLHPATRFAAWIVLAAIMPWLSPHALLWLGVGVALVCVVVPGVAWRRYLRRSAVLLLSILLVYGFATPGEPLVGQAPWSLSREGLVAGTQQAARLGILVMALAIVLSHLSREQLFAGVYRLLTPLRVLSLPTGKLAVRLWLTLHYVDAGTPAKSLAKLDALWEQPSDSPTELTLVMPRFGLADVMAMVVCALCVGSLLA